MSGGMLNGAQVDAVTYLFVHSMHGFQLLRRKAG